jgi:hypothetical protein
VEPGTYVIEKINIGGGPTTVGPGLDARSHTPRFGSFTMRAGEVLNLGRLVVHMHWHEGYFDARIEDSDDETRDRISGTDRWQPGCHVPCAQMDFSIGFLIRWRIAPASIFPDPTQQ